MSALRKKNSSHLWRPEKSSKLSLKERLVQHLARGEHRAAEAVHAEIKLTRAHEVAAQEAANTQVDGVSTAVWMDGGKVIESVTLEPTPEAAEWFAHRKLSTEVTPEK